MTLLEITKTLENFNMDCKGFLIPKITNKYISTIDEYS